MKKLITTLMILVLLLSCTFSLAACGSTDEADDGAAAIIVLLPDATHGWTGSVLTYAQEYAAANTSSYSITVQTATSSDDMNTQIDDLIANGKTDAVVILPYDDDAASGVEALDSAGIPFVMFDRVITASEGDSIANVTGDNYGIGYETAKAFVEAGMEPGDKILIMPGDNSSVPEARNNGFFAYLSEAGWTSAQITAAITYTDYTAWSRDTSKELFTNWMSSTSVADIEATDWIFTHDDEIVMGILEILESSAGLEADKVAAFLDGTTTLAGSSGSQEIYAIMEGSHSTDYSSILNNLSSIFSVTYDPAMIQSAIQDMVDYLDGESVVQDHVISVSVVDADNVDDFQGFGGYVGTGNWDSSTFGN